MKEKTREMLITTLKGGFLTSLVAKIAMIEVTNVWSAVEMAMLLSGSLLLSFGLLWHTALCTACTNSKSN